MKKLFSVMMLCETLLLLPRLFSQLTPLTVALTERRRELNPTGNTSPHIDVHVSALRASAVSSFLRILAK